MLDELLVAWIGHQRWFGGKGRPIDRLSVESDVELTSGLRHLIVAVWQEGSRDRYQILLGQRYDLPDRLEHAVIGQFHDWLLYDAAHDYELTGWLLDGMAADEDRGDLRMRHTPGVTIDTSQRSLVLGAEQSNTSLVYGDAYICKLFRRLIPGINPELEVVAALAARNAPHIAQPYGWIECDLDGTPTTLAFMQRFLPNANDGWDLALTSVRDLYNSAPGIGAAEAGGDFAAESRRLGAATARVHHELAEAFPTDVIETHEVKRMAEGFRRRLGRAVAEVPELREYVGALEAAYHLVEDLTVEVPVQRVHGDYHLGQVMRTPTDWVVLDFEGEPGQPLAERRALSSPLRDVAGMLRSFDYAARHLLAGHADAATLEPRADEWSRRNRAAFLEGYAEAGGVISADGQALLRAFELSKAVYEVVYEARNRPSWIGIPLAAFRQDAF
ncbi:maltokinase N-terminal cap-like domain-containing protein [Nonomuraea cavernae]|uniref:Maltokinase n=1 Tax=Nonomuraea cavernae TaxID=2045107 RepID=A0A918DH57_9ACTN|nr:phosphotransferase [Nonomuraea cavernae]MCA2184933.1 phosphotransferase [Nonomuraea cavernae]GGO64899.1 aminoglycoside phosphotransferase [Nonomuraea cavernae]